MLPRSLQIASVVLLALMAAPAQQAYTLSQRAVLLVLHTYALDSNTRAPGASLAGNVRWSVDKAPPPDCARCVTVHYTDLRTAQVSSWTVRNSDLGLVVVSEDENAAGMWVRKLKRSEAEPLVITARDAAYPQRALAVRQTGSVTVQIAVNADGKLTRSRVLTGSFMLQSAALEAANAMTFRPFYVGTMPVRWVAAIRYDFRLNSNGNATTGRTSEIFLDR